MNQLSRRSLLTVATNAVLAALPAHAQDAKPIKIGQLTIDSGPFASTAKDNATAARVATEILNSEGGALGRKFEVVVN